ncbi:MAG: pseudouridine synthase [Longicatena sp.]
MERLQKVIAASGVTSRRKAEVMISEGRVCVNDVVISELGYKVKKGDFITVDGNPIEKENKVYFLMNKPKKVMCTNDDQFDRQTVIDLIDCKERIFSVGRLDYDTSGVLVLTNDGEFANSIIHPRYHIPKVYNLTINGILTNEDMQKIKKGIILDDGAKTLPAKYKMTEKDIAKNQCSFDLTIMEGRNRQIKRMMEALGYEVKRLHRKELAFLKCNDLRQGEYRILKPFEIKQLKSLAEKGEMKR